MIALSGAVPTINGAKLLPSVLPALCELCDEVVVLVDSLTTDDTIEVARRFTDRVFVFPHDDLFKNMQLAAFEHARGEWILRLADDETLSPQWRRDRVDELLANRRVTQIATPTRWLVPPGNLAIGAGRWYPHYEPRLYRNIPSLAVFGTSPHDLMTIAGEELRLADLIVYHWNLAIKGRAQREERVEYYRHADPSFPCAEWYLYEDEYHEITSFDDRPGAAFVTEAVRSPSDSAHTVDMRAFDVPARMVAGERYAVRLEVANRTGRTLQAPSKLLGESNFAIGYHWFRGDDIVEFAPEELPLFASFEPLDVRSAFISVRAPLEPGRYTLEFDLLERGVTWFSQSFAAGDHAATPIDVVGLEAMEPLAAT